jgi:hypothetical protein
MEININTQFEFSLHAVLKMDLLKKHEFPVSKEEIIDILKNPDKIERGYKNRYIAQKLKDEKHVIRVVFEMIDESKILIITIYPGRSDRYE